jgi:hypothetical protein
MQYMIDLEKLRHNDSSDLFMRLDTKDMERRDVLMACMPHVHFWDDEARAFYKSVIEKTFFYDKVFFAELLSNGENDSSPLIYAHPDIRSDEELLFMAMQADQDFLRDATTFEIYATEEQKKDLELIQKVIERFPEQVEFLNL